MLEVSFDIMQSCAIAAAVLGAIFFPKKDAEEEA